MAHPDISKMRQVCSKMKRTLLLLIFFFALNNAMAQGKTVIQEIKDFQEDLTSSFRDPETSPLTAEDQKSFVALDFYPIDTNFRVEAKFIRTPMEVPFEMPTTTERRPLYVKYGEVYFQLEGREFRMNIYQNLELISKPEYVDYLFVPFTDLTNGKGSYSGGRYIDTRIPLGKKIVLDFNKAYNPYCAYNGKYSCPIPPEENQLEVEIRAGVKDFEH